MVRLVFRPYTQISRSICTSESLRASTRVSPGFALFRHSSPSFGSQHVGCFCVLVRYVCMVRCGRPAVFVWLCKLHTIEYHVMCHATVVVSSTNVFKVEESRRLHVVLYTGESVPCIHSLLYVLDNNNAVTHNTSSRRTAAGRLTALLVYIYTYNRGVVQHDVLRSFWTCTTTRMQL